MHGTNVKKSPCWYLESLGGGGRLLDMFIFF